MRVYDEVQLMAAGLKISAQLEAFRENIGGVFAAAADGSRPRLSRTDYERWISIPH